MATTKEHRVIPHADTIITLKNATIAFAEWQPTGSEPTEPETPVDESELEMTDAPDSGSNADSDSAEEEIGDHEYYVSSSILALSSKTFGRMLGDGKWSESRKGEDGFFHISAEGWNHEAFLIMLNVFHHQNKKVPRSVSLDTMAKIAILVDYYECEETMELYADIWIPDLRKNFPLPEDYCRDLMLWILVAQVFRLADEFENATKVAIQKSNEPIRTLNLPISPHIVEQIDNQRYRAIEHIMARLHDLLATYRNPKYTCPSSSTWSSACASMLLGSLTRQMDSKGIFSPRPEIPFTGLSIPELVQTIRTIDSPTWIPSGGYNSYGTNCHSCSLNTAVRKCMDSEMTDLQGLILGKGRDT